MTVAQDALDFLAANCRVSPRVFTGTDESNSFGVYAIPEIPSRQVIFEDYTILASTNISASAPSSLQGSSVCDHCCGSISPGSHQQIRSKCCAALYCSEECRSTAMTFYHGTLCKKHFDWLFGPVINAKARDPPLDGLLWLRTLAICVHSDCRPIDHPRIASLVP